MQYEYGNGGSYALVIVSIFFGWISKISMDQIAWIISLVSGVLACISFSLRIAKDWPWRKKKGGDDERMV